MKGTKDIERKIFNLSELFVENITQPLKRDGPKKPPRIHRTTTERLDIGGRSNRMDFSVGQRYTKNASIEEKRHRHRRPHKNRRGPDLKDLKSREQPGGVAKNFPELKLQSKSKIMFKSKIFRAGQEAQENIQGR